VSKKGLAWAALAIGVSLFVGCATGGGSGPDDEGDGGNGGAGNGMGGAGPGPGPGPGASSSSSSAQSSSSSSASASSGGGGMCGAGQHLCAGVCTPNTPESGCFQSPDCSPCPTTANGKATCNAQGLCDVSCNSGYDKSGNSCVCPQQCCSNAECASGQTCMGGACSGGGSGGGGGGCDQFACTTQCLLQMKFGVCGPSGCMCI
jgi:hypothetical protein